MTIGERIRELRGRMTLAEFGQFFDVGASNISGIEKGHSKPSFELAEKICQHFNVSMDWLIRGEEYKKAIISNESKKTISNAYEIGEFVYNLEENKENYTAKNNNFFIDLGSGKIQMLIPFVEEYAYGGYLSGFMDEKYIKELPKFSIIVEKHHKGNYIAFEVRGDSMNDNSNESICSGDTVVGRNIAKVHWNSRFHLNSWKDYIIVHKEGIIVKRIVAHDVENGVITCESLNPDKDTYPTFDLNLEDIYELYNVIEVSRKRK